MIAEILAKEIRKIIDVHLSEWLKNVQGKRIEVVIDDKGGHRCEEFGFEKNIRIVLDSNRFESCMDMEFAALSICGYEILRYGLYDQILSYENLIIQNGAHELCHAIQFINNDEIFVDEDDYEGYHNAYFYKVMRRFHEGEIGKNFVSSCRGSLKGLVREKEWVFPRERIERVLRVMPGDRMNILQDGILIECEVVSVGGAKVFVKVDDVVICVGMFGLS